MSAKATPPRPTPQSNQNLETFPRTSPTASLPHQTPLRPPLINSSLHRPRALHLIMTMRCNMAQTGAAAHPRARARPALLIAPTCNLLEHTIPTQAPIQGIALRLEATLGQRSTVHAM